jgi:hypothetical protein
VDKKKALAEMCSEEFCSNSVFGSGCGHPMRRQIIGKKGKFLNPVRKT